MVHLTQVRQAIPARSGLGRAGHHLHRVVGHQSEFRSGGASALHLPKLLVSPMD